MSINRASVSFFRNYLTLLHDENMQTTSTNAKIMYAQLQSSNVLRLKNL